MINKNLWTDDTRCPICGHDPCGCKDETTLVHDIIELGAEDIVPEDEKNE